jgi:LuxR family transcriptional regulator
MQSCDANMNAAQHHKAIYKKINSICNELFTYSDIKVFGYRKFFLDGRYLAVCTRQDLQDFYFKNLQNVGKVFFKILLNTNYKSYTYFLWPKCSSKDFVLDSLAGFNVWNGVTIYYRSDHYIESFAFAGDKTDDSLQNYFINNKDILEMFINHFKFKAQDIIDCTDQSKLAIFSNFSNIHSQDTTIPKSSILKSKLITPINVNYKGKKVRLTIRERECLDALSAGLTHKKAALEMNISPKTFQKHVENIKEKTGVSYKADLIDLYNDLIMHKKRDLLFSK